jgi:hypothetical protein
MRIEVVCSDLLTGARVSGADLACTVRVAPRNFRLVERNERVPIVLNGEAVTLPVRSATSGADGTARFEISVAAEFRRMTAERLGDDRFLDVAALVSFQGVWEGMDRGSSFFVATTSATSATGDVDVRRLVLIDPAKTIVGHTTDRTCRLWFQLHGPQVAGRRYECEVRPARQGGPGGQTRQVSFVESRARTAVLDLAGLEPGAAYGYRLWSRQPGRPAADRMLCEGSFQTAGADERELTLLFGSCHKPLDTGAYDPARDLQIWRRLADRGDGDLQLFIGDQVYGDEVPNPVRGERWFDGYVRRYNAFWAYQPVRQALGSRPTYMATDDHEVTDDWGMDESIPDPRITDGVEAFRVFQLAHSPVGVDSPVLHYHFRRGPVAFFVMDGRSQRGTDRDFPIFGRRQWRDFVAWASSPETRRADVIVFVSPVPVALLPIENLRDAAREAATVTGTLAGLLTGGLFGGGPVAGAVLGAVGASLAYDKIEEDQLGGSDFREMWTLESNQGEMTRLLNVLFALANDLNLEEPDAGPGPRPRAVFVLGGDCHFGLAHLIASNRRGGPDHRRNPQLMHLTSSAIGRPPQDRPAMRALFQDLDETPPDFDSIKERLVGLLSDRAVEFVLDDRGDKHYRAAALGALFERNVGRLQIRRVGDGRRYQFDATIEGETRSLVQLFEVDLDARPVRWRSLVGQVLTLAGRLAQLRVNEVDGRFGPPSDRLDAEVIVELDSAPGRFFGFQLRRDGDEQVRTQMLDTLRAALNQDRPVRIDFRRTGVRNGELIRVDVLA